MEKPLNDKSEPIFISVYNSLLKSVATIDPCKSDVVFRFVDKFCDGKSVNGDVIAKTSFALLSLVSAI